MPVALLILVVTPSCWLVVMPIDSWRIVLVLGHEGGVEGGQSLNNTAG
jgi:hypothetical protein